MRRCVRGTARVRATRALTPAVAVAAAAPSQGQAQRILLRAKANAQTLHLLAGAMRREGALPPDTHPFLAVRAAPHGLPLPPAGASGAASVHVANQYINAFQELARKSTTLVLPADAGAARCPVPAPAASG